ncbi:hypothetical protein ABH922_000011 [Rhodococcus sp. 27YEA15]|uniref:hypothetical protein n=1 Tax=Rhodococcus sp. 27YEA15 TaxID=3156259 RepID=UPI003C7BBECC
MTPVTLGAQSTTTRRSGHFAPPESRTAHLTRQTLLHEDRNRAAQDVARPLPQAVALVTSMALGGRHTLLGPKASAILVGSRPGEREDFHE